MHFVARLELIEFGFMASAKGPEGLLPFTEERSEGLFALASGSYVSIHVPSSLPPPHRRRASGCWPRSRQHTCQVSAARSRF